MKIRLILLSLLGIAAYIVLATYNSKMIRETPVPSEHARISAPQPHPATSPIPEKATEKHPMHQEEAVSSQQKETIPPPPPPAQPDTQPETSAAPQKLPEPSGMQLTVESQPANAEEVQLLQAEIAQKEQEIRQLLEAQETVAGKYRELLARSDAGAADAAAKEKMLQEAAERIKMLTADKERSATELANTKSALEQRNRVLEKLKVAAKTKTEQFRKEKEALYKTAQQQKAQYKTAQQQIKERVAENDRLKTQLTDTAAQLKVARTDLEKAELSLKEKEELYTTAQQQAQQQILQQKSNADKLTAQLTDTAAQLKAARADLEKAELKANEALEFGQEKENQRALLEKQKGILEKSLQGKEKTLQEKSAALNAATLTIQALRQEVAAQPQAVATIQNLLDERNNELEQIKQESAARIEQLKQEVTELNATQKQTAEQLNQSKADVETAQQKLSELEAALQQAQALLPENEKKLAAALESKNTLQNLLNDKEAVISGSQAQTKELQAHISSLNDEKIGLTSQLEAIKAALKDQEATKALFAEQAKTLAAAEAKLQDLAALQAQRDELQTKNSELAQTLKEKTSALEDSARQGEELTALQAKVDALNAQSDAHASTIKQLEAVKMDLTKQLTTAQAQAQETETLKKSLDEKSSALMLAQAKVKELADASEQITALQDQLIVQQTAQKAVEEKAAQSERALAECNLALTAGSEKVHALEGEVAAAQNRIKVLMDEHQLQQLQDQVPNLNQQIATLRVQVAELEATTTQVKKSLTDANAAVAAKTSELQTLQTKNDQLQEALKAKQATITELQQQVEVAKNIPEPAPMAPTPVATPQAEKKPDTTAVQDSDKDGLADSLDLCPDSPAGAPVNGLGCPADKGIILEGVNFKSGTANLLTDAQQSLDSVVATLLQLPHITVEIAGYTDSVGNPARNRELSTLRAQAVRQYFLAKGIAADRLIAKGYGQENPIADNATSDGRQKNRRVELHPITR